MKKEIVFSIQTISGHPWQTGSLTRVAKEWISGSKSTIFRRIITCMQTNGFASAIEPSGKWMMNLWLAAFAIANLLEYEILCRFSKKEEWEEWKWNEWVDHSDDWKEKRKRKKRWRTSVFSVVSHDWSRSWVKSPIILQLDSGGRYIADEYTTTWKLV